jgi:hypothetical protein
MIDWSAFRAAFDVSSPLTEALQRLLARIPASQELASSDPRRRSEAIGKIASMKAAAISGSLALPPGPAGLLAIVPDLYLIWRLQGQMVSDIAASYGKTALLTREGLAYCLFKHGSAQLLRDLAVRSGQRLLIRSATLEALQSILRNLGLHLSERLASRAAARWVPLLGSVGVGVFAYHDTARIARTAVEVFQSDLSIEDPPRLAAS